MSAVFGIYYRDGRPVDRELALMSRTLAHRGTVEHGWQEGNVALGVREGASGIGKLLVTDNLVFAGELRLDDPEGLRETLGAPKEATDVELVLAAYRKWGENCPIHILGDFAFAIWDRTRKHLFCARDCFGVRPFYYHESLRLFAFASEAKALIRLPNVSKALNQLRIGDWLIDLRQDKVATLFKDVVRLPPSCRLRIEEWISGVSAYWDVRYVPILPRQSTESYLEGYRDHLRQAVRARIGPGVGAPLSGGLDSSSIVCLATEILGSTPADPFQTYSAIFRESEDSDESEFIDSVSATQPILSHRYYPDGTSLFAGLDYQLGLDEPIWQPQTIVQRHGLQVAKSIGLTAVLHGHGGDEVTSYGTTRLSELFSELRWFELWREASGPNGTRTIARTASIVLSFGARPVISGWIPRIVRKAVGREEQLWDPQIPIRKEVSLQHNLEDRWRSLTVERSRPPRSVRESDCRKIGSGELVLTLEVASRIGGMFGMNLRFPFLDRRLVEFCLNVPSELKLRDGWQRWIGRKSLDPILPPPVAWRKAKLTGDSVVVGLLARRDLDLMHDELLGADNVLERYVDDKGVQALFQRFSLSPNWRDGHILWRLTTLSRFLRAHAG